MKAIIVVLLAVCAYGQTASTGVKVQVNGRELVYTTADQEIYGVAYLQPGYSMKWHDAQLECLEAGYKGLLSIKSLAAQDAVEFALVSLGVSSSAWIGLHRATTSEDYTWADGTALGNYNNWLTEGPINKAAGVWIYGTNSSNAGKWYSLGLSTAHSYCLCEF